MNFFKRTKTPSNDIPSNYWPDLVWWAFCLALLAIILYSLKIEDTEHIGDFWQTLGKLIGILGAGFVLGFIIGLVFGIPRTSTSSKEEKNADNQRSNTRETQYSINTNLEEISDWLTKVVIGFTLAQIPQLGKGIIAIVKTLNDPEQGFIAAIVVYSLCSGIIYGYLWGRVKLRRIDEQIGNPGKLKHSYKFQRAIQSIQSDQDYETAKELLNEAINQRGKFNQIAEYELWRAFCNIKLENPNLEEIAQDLQIAKDAKLLEDEKASINEWIQDPANDQIIQKYDLTNF